MRSLGAFLLLATLCSADEAEIAARTKWGEARAALEKKDGKTALARFEEALKGLPSDPQLLYEAARCALDQGDLERADKWVGLVVRTEDAAFKQRPQFQEAFTLAAKVRAAREAAAATAAYAKPIELVEDAIRRIRSKEKMIVLLSHTFVEIHRDLPNAQHPLKESLAEPGVFSGWALSEKMQPHGSCRFALEGITTEKTANAIFDRFVEAAKKELPEWKRLAARFENMDPRILEDKDDTVWWDRERVDPSLRPRSIAYVMKTNAKEDDLFTPKEIKLLLITMYEHVDERRNDTFRVVVRMEAGFP